MCVTCEFYVACESCMMSVARGDNIEYGSLIMGYMYGYSHVLASIGDIYIHVRFSL